MRRATSVTGLRTTRRRLESRTGVGCKGILLTSADVAKRSGLNGFHFAGLEATETVGEFELELDLSRALLAEQFVLHFQTIHDPRSMSAHGVGALVRWRHPVRGLLSPAVFIPNLEETGFIVDVGAWVLDRTLSELAGWQQQGHCR
jgi:predicted signal transduction protein with EAL and GGDEF domain